MPLPNEVLIPAGAEFIGVMGRSCTAPHNLVLKVTGLEGGHYVCPVPDGNGKTVKVPVKVAQRYEGHPTLDPFKKSELERLALTDREAAKKAGAPWGWE